MMSCNVLLETRLHHTELNSFLLEYEARKLGLETQRIAPLFLKVWDSNTSAAFRKSAGPGISRAAFLATKYKYYTKIFLRSAGIPVNDYRLLASGEFDSAVSFAESHNYEVVLKPVDGFGGKGVYTTIKDRTDLEYCFDRLRKKFRGANDVKHILIERKFIGNEFRFFVIDGEVSAVLERLPANVVGDGTSSIEQLVRERNDVRSKNPDLRSRLIKIDGVVLRNLESQRLRPSSIVSAGRHVQLRDNSNVSSGGDSIDRTEFIPGNVKNLVSAAVAAVPNLLHAGVDVISKDISAGSLGADNIVVNELEGDAAMCMHHFPGAGTPRNVARLMLLSHFRQLRNRNEPQPYIHDFDEHADLSREILDGIVQARGVYRHTQASGSTRPGTASRSYVELAGSTFLPEPEVKARAQMEASESGDISLFMKLQGTVQGVGFRQSARRHARKAGLNGWVRNVDNGSVEILLRGSRNAAYLLHAKVIQGLGRAEVSASQTKVTRRVPAQGFVIRKTRRSAGKANNSSTAENSRGKARRPYMSRLWGAIARLLGANRRSARRKRTLR